jgi:hypothetical protein
MYKFRRIIKIANMILAANTVTEYSSVPMKGTLKVQKGNGHYAVLTVPEDFADNIFETIKGKEEGMEKPPYNPHISVMTDEEVDSVGPIEEAGQEFEYTISSVESCDPEGWDEMEKAWFVRCKSPQLEQLRERYGLTPLMNGDHEFHITLAVRPKKGTD